MKAMSHQWVNIWYVSVLYLRSAVDLLFQATLPVDLRLGKVNRSVKGHTLVLI